MPEPTSRGGQVHEPGTTQAQAHSLPERSEKITVTTPPSLGTVSVSKIEVCGTVRSTSAEQGLVRAARKRVGLGNWPDSGFGMQLESLTDEYLEFYEELLTR